MPRSRALAIAAAVITVVSSVAAIWAAANTSDSEAASASTEPADAAATTAAIEIADFQFIPAEATVAPGTQVTWTNTDGLAHNIRSEDGTIESPNFEDGGTFSFTFQQPGTYPYFCGIHNSMRGTIVVEE